MVDSIDLIIFYCANYTCTAAKSYASNILSQRPDLVEKSILYEGGLLEWSSLSLTYEEFGIFDLILEDYATMMNCMKLTEIFHIG